MSLYYVYISFAMLRHTAFEGGTHTTFLSGTTCVMIELTRLFLYALSRIQMMKNGFRLQQLCICKLMQACGFHGQSGRLP